MDLFSQDFEAPNRPEPPSPLAERVRPRTLDDFVGQEHVIGPGTPLREALQHKRISSMILWGPPGVGKTTLARILAGHIQGEFVAISAVTSGVADVRRTIDAAAQNRRYRNRVTVLFIDEIHRFNKAQQDALLHAVEDGTLILIGATTENPSFEVISPLLSRSQVYQLQPLGDAHLRRIVEHALASDEQLAAVELTIEDWDGLLHLGAGDARRVLNTLERAADLVSNQPLPRRVDRDILERAAQRKIFYYDKSGDYHYDLISAFIKSLRGSDPDAALYWMARMLAGGEDPKFIARRMIIFAAEDVGNAEPMAVSVATACFTAVTYIGLPEGRIVLAQAATYLAAAPKSNAAYLGIDAAMAAVESGPETRVPLHLRNAPTRVMKNLDYGKGYKYPHDFPGHFVEERYLPEELGETQFYHPTGNGAERPIRDRLRGWWKRGKRYETSDTPDTGSSDNG